MARTPRAVDRLQTLVLIQKRVRALAQRHEWFADALRSAFVAYRELGDRYLAEVQALRDREEGLARELLARGFLFDPAARDNSPCLFVSVEGLCPKALAQELERFPNGNCPRALEKRGAAAALTAFDQEQRWQSRELPEQQREKIVAERRRILRSGLQVEFTWRIVVSRPADWREPNNPHSLDPEDLEQFSDVDFRAIALYRLGGLADTRALRPIVSKPAKSGDPVRDIGLFITWRSRFPVDQNQGGYDDLCERKFPPDVAEQMMNVVEAWVGSKSAKQPEQLLSGDVPDSEYLPATAFPKGLLPKLRMAARKGRKTKRVRTRRIDGVTLYCMEDVCRWWPNELE